MGSKDDVLAEALRLPREGREELVRVLIRSLDEGEEEDPAVAEAGWAEEIGRRLERMEREGGQEIPVDEAMERARKAIEKRRTGGS